MRFNASTTRQNRLKMAGAIIHKINSEVIEDFDAENTKRQIKYAVFRMYLKNYDMSCLINCSVKSKSLYWYYVKQIMSVFIRAIW